MAYQDPRWGGGNYYPPEDPPEDQFSREAEYAPPPGPPPTSDYGQEGYYQPPPGPPPGPFQGNLGYAPPQFPPPGIRPPPSPSPQEFTHQYRPDGQAGGPMAIPTYAQNFHQQLPQYQFQYSQCTGRRKALLIGINYIGTQNQLKGCINDVLNIKHFIIQRFGFREEDMVILTDDAQNPASRPTKQNMARAMQWLVQGARPQDSLFFHYSGHGGQSVDWNSEQDDVYDEVIYPVDFKQAGSLSNIDMHDIMVKLLPAGCRLTCIFDCCHSGSALALPYEYGADGLVKEPNVLHEAGHGLLDAYQSYQSGQITQVLADGASIVKAFTRTKEDRERIRVTRTSPADVIQMSGCKNYQTSADTVEGGMPTGAMSWAFREVLTKQPQQSYHSLLLNVRELLASRYRQTPVLSSSHPIDTRLQFIM